MFFELNRLRPTLGGKEEPVPLVSFHVLSPMAIIDLLYRDFIHTILHSKLEA